MNYFELSYSGVGWLLLGAGLWICSILLPMILPELAAISAVLMLFGKGALAIGVIAIVVDLFTRRRP